MDGKLVMRIAAILAGLLAAVPAPAAPRFSTVNLVNQTGQTMTGLFVRRTGTQGWTTLTVTPPRPGRGVHAVAPYSDIDCAFDFRATLEDGKDGPVDRRQSV